jgi:hypothetical protein
MGRSEIILTAVHNAWRAVSLSLGESPVRLEDAPEWRRSALEHTIGFWESWSNYDDLDVQAFCAATQLAWTQYHRRHNWTHTELAPFIVLPLAQRRKLIGMLKAYILVREQLGPPEFTP